MGIDVPTKEEEALTREYNYLCHAMQTGVKYDHEVNGANDGTPKHLRVGVNVALCNHSALVRLLISKGLFTYKEYLISIRDAMQTEVNDYTKRLPPGFTLG